MQFIQHSSQLPIENLDYFEKNIPKKKHGSLFPNSCRFLFTGPSGCGKSNALLALLFSPNGLQFENIYIYSKSLHQPKYLLLAEVLKNIPGIGYYSFENNEDVIDPKEAHENSVFIFDDVVCEKQDKIKAYYSMGRHKFIDVAFLCQTYVKISKHLIRDNANIIVVFKQDDINMKHIFDEHVSPDMPYEDFKKICSLSWNDHKYGFLVIVKDFNLNEGRYRKGFDTYIKLKH